MDTANSIQAVPGIAPVAAPKVITFLGTSPPHVGPSLTPPPTSFTSGANRYP